MKIAPMPWRIGGKGYQTMIVDADDKAVCAVTARKDQWNAPILAYSPDMLDLLRRLVNPLNSIEFEFARQDAANLIALLDGEPS